MRAQVRVWADEAQGDPAPPIRRCAASTTTGTSRSRSLKLEIDQDKARALGVTSQSVAQASRTILSGTTIGQYREGDKLVDIVLRQPQEERNAITDLGSANLPTASGRSVPLTQIAKVGFGWEPGVIWREGRNFAVTVQGDVVDGIQGPTVTHRSLAEARRAADSACRRATRSRSPGRSKKAARGRVRSRSACR